VDLHLRAPRQFHRQQAIGPEVSEGDRQSGNGTEIERLYQPQAEPGAGTSGDGLGLLLARLDGPQQGTGGHHQVARQPAQEEQHTQPGIGEMRQGVRPKRHAA
jgi:hypothetical protein